MAEPRRGRFQFVWWWFPHQWRLRWERFEGSYRLIYKWRVLLGPLEIRRWRRPGERHAKLLLDTLLGALEELDEVADALWDRCQCPQKEHGDPRDCDCGLLGLRANLMVYVWLPLDEARRREFPSLRKESER